MNILDAEKLADELMFEHLNDSERNWVFKWTNAKRTFGTCSYGRRGYFIKLSRPLTELNDYARVRNTILHEIAHALDVEQRGRSSHDAYWVRIAKSIGCDGKRCYNSNSVEKPSSKYTLDCPSCGKSSPRHRRPKHEVACRPCCDKHNGGKFTRTYLMELKLM